MVADDLLFRLTLILLLAAALATSIRSYRRSLMLAVKVRELETALKAMLECKKLTPASRELNKQIRKRRRYIVFRVISDSPVKTEDLEKSIEETFALLYGKPSLGDSMLSLVYHNEGSGYGVIRVSADWKDRAILALSLIRRINRSKTFIVPIRTTGTIRKAREIIFSLKS